MTHRINGDKIYQTTQEDKKSAGFAVIVVLIVGCLLGMLLFALSSGK